MRPVYASVLSVLTITVLISMTFSEPAHARGGRTSSGGFSRSRSTSTYRYRSYNTNTGRRANYTLGTSSGGSRARAFDFKKYKTLFVNRTQKPKFNFNQPSTTTGNHSYGYRSGYSSGSGSGIYPWFYWSHMLNNHSRYHNHSPYSANYTAGTSYSDSWDDSTATTTDSLPVAFSAKTREGYYSTSNWDGFQQFLESYEGSYMCTDEAVEFLGNASTSQIVKDAIRALEKKYGAKISLVGLQDERDEVPGSGEDSVENKNHGIKFEVVAKVGNKISRAGFITHYPCSEIDDFTNDEFLSAIGRLGNELAKNDAEGKNPAQSQNKRKELIQNRAGGAPAKACNDCNSATETKTQSAH